VLVPSTVAINAGICRHEISEIAAIPGIWRTAGCRPGGVIFDKVVRHRRLTFQHASSKSHINGDTGEAIPG